MSDGPDPYRVLDVEPGADAAEVREAFHDAVLRCHPDCCRGDVEAARQRFAEVVAAYRSLREELYRRSGNDEDQPVRVPFNPADFARMSFGWDRGDLSQVPADMLEWLPSVVHQKVREPALPETGVFVGGWILSLVLSLVAGALSAAAASGFCDDQESAVAWGVLGTIGTYAAMVVLLLTGIINSRRTAWLLRVIGFRKQRALPAPRPGRQLKDPR